MSQVSDYTLSNIGFSAFRTELNSILGAVNTLNAGTSAPGSVAAGSLWLDTTSATTPTLKFYDGSDQISLCTFNYSANTVNWLDNTVSMSGAYDLEGAELTLDGDNDTSITASTDDQIDIEVAGADDFTITANSFNILSGSALTINAGGSIANAGSWGDSISSTGKALIMGF